MVTGGPQRGPAPSVKTGEKMDDSAPTTPEQPTLEQQIVAFMDLLGFTDRMLDAAEDPKASEKLLVEYHRVMQKALARLDDWHGHSHRGFTDNLVLSAPLAKPHPEANFGSVALQLGEFQLTLALEGWFLRGGLTAGAYYQDERIVFGPALVEAYWLESEHARDPRIVLSDTALGFHEHFLTYYAEPGDAPQNQYVMVDTDGRAFINYLFVGLEFGMADAIEQHKNQVENALENHVSRPPVWAKYRWVAAYHDYFCKSYFGDDLDRLLISTDAMQASPTRLVDRAEREN